MIPGFSILTKRSKKSLLFQTAEVKNPGIIQAPAHDTMKSGGTSSGLEPSFQQTTLPEESPISEQLSSNSVDTTRPAQAPRPLATSEFER